MSAPKYLIDELYDKINKCEKLSELQEYSSIVDSHENAGGIKQVVQELRNHIFDKSVELFFNEYPVKQIKPALVRKSKSKNQ
jgi:hypothetical protein